MAYAKGGSVGGGGGGVPGTRQVIAGTGLTGGGPLSSDVTLALSTPVSIANGGTNNAALSVTNGNIFYGDGSKLVALGIGTNGQVLASTGTLPAWQTVTIPSLPVSLSNGGTNNSLTASNGALAYSDASKIVLLAAGTNGQMLQQAAGVPSWVTRTITAGTGLAGGGDLSADRTISLTAPVSIANGGTNNTALGVTNGAIVYADGSKLISLAAGTNGQMLQQAAGVPSWVTRTITAGTGLTGGGDLSADRTISLSTPVAIASGGTNNTALSVTNGNLIYADGSKLVALAIGSTGQILTVAGGLPSWAAAGASSLPVSGGGATISQSSGLLSYTDGGADATVAHTFDTTTTRSSSDLLDIKNHGTLKVSVAFDGTLNFNQSSNIASTSSNSNMTIKGNQNGSGSGTDVLITSNANRTAGNILDIQNQGSSRFTIDFRGKITTQSGGAAAVAGQSTLVAGVKTVSTTAAKTGDFIFISWVTAGGTLGVRWSVTISDATSFTVTSLQTGGGTETADTSTFNWWIIK